MNDFCFHIFSRAIRKINPFALDFYLHLPSLQMPILHKYSYTNQIRNGMNIKKLGTFEEWLKEEEKKRLNESNVSIEVDWWDQCIVEVMQDLEEDSGGFLDWTELGDFIKAKFSIIGRKWDEYIDNIYVLYIKDLIFQHHGRSFCDDIYDDNAALHTKGVVVEQLAHVIYDKLCEKLGSGMDSTNTKIKVADYEPAPEPDDICDDFDALPFEHKKVKKFKAYTRHLNEATKKAVKDNLEGCTAYCIERIEKEVGSLDPDAIYDAAVKNATPQFKARLTLLYVMPMVRDYLGNNSIIIAGLDDSEGSKEMLRQVIDELVHSLADDVLYAIFKINGGVDVEVE